MKMFDVVLLMAGQGLRSGLPMNKVFYPVLGKPIYQYALDAFLAIPDCGHVVLVIREEDRIRLPQYDDPRIIITTGGLLRQDSVAKGVACCQESIVLVHDAARANIKKPTFWRFTSIILCQAAILAYR
jgi:2-C-methyl-D-erythritol 4-phosphate cytidylyltransferase